MTIDKNASNQSGGSFTIDTNGIYRAARVKRVTTYTREFDDKGNLVKETEVVTEYEPHQSAPYQPYPYQPVWTGTGMTTYND